MYQVVSTHNVRCLLRSPSCVISHTSCCCCCCSGGPDPHWRLPTHLAHPYSLVSRLSAFASPPLPLILSRSGASLICVGTVFVVSVCSVALTTSQLDLLTSACSRPSNSTWCVRIATVSVLLTFKVSWVILETVWCGRFAAQLIGLVSSCPWLPPGKSSCFGWVLCQASRVDTHYHCHCLDP